ncbi:MAG: bifunctional nuclease family protein [Bdellovibrionaceae bacterium]|nr:bifunctional nuclease family protein [Pseudobdellovibrionaceae bacterium]MBX3035040.1 bifunctional nuclease family protein [Pseudobdellovibrionaceae bacterium]
MRFASSQAEEETFHQDDLIQLFPFGLSLNVDSERPLLLLKDERHEFTLPVALTPIEAGVTLTQSNPTAVPATPHRFTQLLMESLGIQARQAVFVQIKGAHQFLRLYLQGHPSLNSIKVRADEAMSLCLQLGLPVFATRDFIQRSRLMTAEMEGLKQGLKKNPQVLRQRASRILQ